MNLKEAILAGSKADNVTDAMRLLCTAMGLDLDALATEGGVSLEDFAKDNAESWAAEDENSKAIDLCRVAAAVVGSLLPLAITMDIISVLKAEQDIDGEADGDAPSSEVGVN